MPVQTHPVVIAGAGPGDPELITVKGQKALMEADLIIYAGSLVPEELLTWASPAATAVSSAGMTLDEIVDLIRKSHSSGKRIVRLHTGDPSLYGAIGEQIQALETHGIPCRVIPGVTAAFAAAASMGMEYTLPEVTQTLILTRISGRTPVPDRESLERLAAHQASMAIYLSMGHIQRVQEILVPQYGADSLCAIAYKVSHPEENIVYTRLGDLAETADRKNIDRTALILVGKAVSASQGTVDLVKSKLYDVGFAHGYRQAGERPGA